jgi:L,D-peptidoglycan transpeptidase YkuD (ErfK/YbiS/YcfS/YnhG family)
MGTLSVLVLNYFNQANNSCQILALKNIPTSTTQVLIVRSLGGVKAELSTCELHKNNWIARSVLFPGVIGKQGLAPLGEKREGDLRTPSGLYPIGPAFGSQPLKLKMDYQYITAEDKFIDDPHSKDYNSWMQGETKAKSFEAMLIPLYKIGAVIQYNMQPTLPDLGSAIFLHIWRSSTQGTAGCVAMSEHHLQQILYWLDKKKNPYIYLIN